MKREEKSALSRQLIPKIAPLKESFDRLNISVLTELLGMEPLRSGLSVAAVVDDFRMYMDYFHIHFRISCSDSCSKEDILRKHEEICHRQLDILLYGVINTQNK